MLFYVYPLNGRYVAVSSGLPLWAGSTQQGFSFVPAVHSTLNAFQDYLLFKGSVKDTIAAGYFNNQWQLPQKEVQTLKASGIVSVKE